MNYSGLADINDFKSNDWIGIFNDMEKYQYEFLKFEKNFRSPEYKWPSDPLHNWSRVWEYPYVFYHLNTYFQNNVFNKKVVDIGSGVTFFTPYLASKGFHISATDIDPITEQDLNRAFAFVDTNPGSAEVKLCTSDRLPYENESFDVAISVSVIEHIINIEMTISEIHRILKKDGIFILTFDIDLNSNYELKPETYINFLDILYKYFKIEIQEKVIHPLNVLTSLNSPYPFPTYKTIYHKFLKNIIRKVKDFLHIKYFKHPYLSCEGIVLKKINF